jgi:hypothetical protein
MYKSPINYLLLSIWLTIWVDSFWVLSGLLYVKLLTLTYNFLYSKYKSRSTKSREGIRTRPLASTRPAGFCRCKNLLRFHPDFHDCFYSIVQFTMCSESMFHVSYKWPLRCSAIFKKKNNTDPSIHQNHTCLSANNKTTFLL